MLTKEQLEITRQIGLVGRLLSERNSLVGRRKYPILGTDREIDLKSEAMQKQLLEQAQKQQL